MSMGRSWSDVPLNMIKGIRMQPIKISGNFALDFSRSRIGPEFTALSLSKVGSYENDIQGHLKTVLPTLAFLRKRGKKWHLGCQLSSGLSDSILSTRTRVQQCLTWDYK